MALYQYKCRNCKEEFEVEKPMDCACTEERCECGAVANKVIGTPRIIYASGGFTKRPERDVDAEIQQIIDKEAPQKNYDPFNEMIK